MERDKFSLTDSDSSYSNAASLLPNHAKRTTMPEFQVTNYAYTWKTGVNTGTVLLLLVNGDKATIQLNSAEELAAIGAILREAPVWYRTDDFSLRTSWEMVED
jgi:hypothetical protein